MAMNNSTHGSMTSEMNVTPLIDVLLVLLIIFMVIVPVTSRGEAALAPRQSHHAGTDDDAVVLEVFRGSSGEAGFRINQQAIAREDLSARLAAIYANRAQRVLFVKGDDRLTFTQVAEVIDIGHSAGVDRIGLITPKTQVGL
jgi:biopolymer transport protein ExbD